MKAFCSLIPRMGDRGEETGEGAKGIGGARLMESKEGRMVGKEEEGNTLRGGVHLL